MKTPLYVFKGNVSKVYKFIFVSDLHGCSNEPLIHVIEDENPDAVLVGGDVIHNNEVYKSGLDFLYASSCMCKTFCSLGNHELKFKGDIRGLILENGVTLLDNRYEKFEELYIGGLTSGYKKGSKQSNLKSTPEPDINWLYDFESEDGFKILLSHHPEYYEKYIKEKSIDLTLSGHAHGGQWRFFGRGMFAPGQGVLPKYTSGIYDGKFIVSRGIGNPRLIPRINNPAEVIIIKIIPNK